MEDQSNHARITIEEFSELIIQLSLKTGKTELELACELEYLLAKRREEKQAKD